MDESIAAKETKQKLPKPPRSLGRITGEILAGTAGGAAFAYVSMYVVGYGASIMGLGKGCMDGLWLLVMMVYGVPPFYVFGCAIGVYFVGSRGNQTGSFLATLGGVLLGLPVMALLWLYIGATDMYNMSGPERTILWPLVFLAVPVTATLCFNLTRRYKKPLSC